MQASRQPASDSRPAATSGFLPRTRGYTETARVAHCTPGTAVADCTIALSFWANSPEASGLPYAKRARFSSTQASRRLTPASGLIFGSQPRTDRARAMSDT